MNIHKWVSSIIGTIFVFLGVMISIPFLTLFERKVLSYIQLRKGPKKVSVKGLLQPISDGMKLVFKESVYPFSSKKMFYFFSPLLSFIFMLMLWYLFPFNYSSETLELSCMIFFCVSSLSVYALFFSGWSSKSKYSSLGSFRGVAQLVSYEVSMVMIFFYILTLNFTLNFKKMKNQPWVLMCAFPLFLVFVFTMLAETNRSPFDFAEGESELVSGFKTEYSSFMFALLFLGEYGNMMFLSFITCVCFFSKNMIFMSIFGKIIVFGFFWIRGTFPRFRYDLTMEFGWKVILPAKLIGFFLVFFFY